MYEFEELTYEIKELYEGYFVAEFTDARMHGPNRVFRLNLENLDERINNLSALCINTGVEKAAFAELARACATLDTT